MWTSSCFHHTCNSFTISVSYLPTTCNPSTVYTTVTGFDPNLSQVYPLFTLLSLAFHLSVNPKIFYVNLLLSSHREWIVHLIQLEVSEDTYYNCGMLCRPDMQCVNRQTEICVLLSRRRTMSLCWPMWSSPSSPPVLTTVTWRMWKSCSVSRTIITSWPWAGSTWVSLFFWLSLVVMQVKILLSDPHRIWVCRKCHEISTEFE